MIFRLIDENKLYTYVHKSVCWIAQLFPMQFQTNYNLNSSPFLNEIQFTTHLTFRIANLEQLI